MELVGALMGLGALVGLVKMAFAWFPEGAEMLAGAAMLVAMILGGAFMFWVVEKV
jgi:hypothetical protein